MCLIITGPSANVRATLLNTAGLIHDIFAANEDGLGVMYKNKRGLCVRKVLPKQLDEVTRFIDQLPDDDRNLAMHWRMKTHGDIDLLNCHPYDVVPGRVALMHNGVLHTGNKADKTKSDTWHFIKEFLEGPVAQHKDIVHSDGFLKLLGDYIDNNRFVFMDDEGNMSIVNRDQGVEVGPLWFSNTYAWDPSLLIPSWRPAVYSTGWLSGSYRGANYGFGGAWALGDEDESDLGDVWDTHSTGSSNVQALLSRNEERDFFDAVNGCDTDKVTRVFKQFPYYASRILKERFRPAMSEHLMNAVRDGTVDRELSQRDTELLRAVLEPTPTEMGRLAAMHPAHMAEVVCYYLEWTLIAQPSTDDAPADTQGDDEILDSSDNQVLDYRGYTMHLFYEPGIAGWTYDLYDPTGPCIDSGYGYESKLEALKWACDAVDDEIAIMDETTAVAGDVPDVVLDAVAEAGEEREVQDR